MPSDCMGNQEISSVFVRCTFCAADRPRAAEVHGQRKIYQRTTHAMAMFLQSYNFKVEAIKGSENVGADYLSRVEE